METNERKSYLQLIERSFSTIIDAARPELYIKTTYI